MPHHDHYCSAAYRTSKTDYFLGEEDMKAIEILEKAGLQYTLVDLGLASTSKRLMAKLEGVTTTPTLIYRGQKLQGISQIMSMPEIRTDV